MRKQKTDVQWVDIWIIGRLFGIANPYLKLQKCTEAGLAKRIGRGRYRVNRARIRRHLAG